MSNITVKDLGQLLAKEIAKNFFIDGREVPGELYYEWLIRKLEDEKESAVASAADEIAALRFEKKEIENKATARALLDGEHIAQLENLIDRLNEDINSFDRCNTQLTKERDEYQTDYIRVCKKYSKTMDDNASLRCQLNRIHEALVSNGH